METPATKGAAYQYPTLGRSVNGSIVHANAMVELKSRYANKFRVTGSISIEITGKEMVAAIAIFPPTVLDLQFDQEVIKNLPLSIFEIDDPSRPFDELIANVRAYLDAGVKSCWLVQPRMRCVFLFTSSGVYTHFGDDQVAVDPATGIELPLAPLFE